MRARTALVPILFASLVAAGACGNDPTGPRPVAEQFEAYWQAFDREYPYFPLRGIDWDAPGRRAAAPLTAVEWIPVSDAGVGSVAPPRPHGA